MTQSPSSHKRELTGRLTARGDAGKRRAGGCEAEGSVSLFCKKTLSQRRFISTPRPTARSSTFLFQNVFKCHLLHSPLVRHPTSTSSSSSPPSSGRRPHASPPPPPPTSRPPPHPLKLRAYGGHFPWIKKRDFISPPRVSGFNLGIKSYRLEAEATLRHLINI